MPFSDTDDIMLMLSQENFKYCMFSCNVSSMKSLHIAACIAMAVPSRTIFFVSNSFDSGQ